ncbi:MAG: gamma-glutamyl-gamma-aminobutyrate hydrolase family protein [Verrucomicrobiales bacterium]|nr:gamma-glutamyl-gamma-aminobutyrate hydrolase family protein [Verrucomicrobiales bacterium]
MAKPPVILISPSIERQGEGFRDLSLCLAQPYQDAVTRAGAVPMILPATTSRQVIAEFVRQADGVLLTGGDDVNPALYRPDLPPRLERTVKVTPDDGARDLREMIVVAEVLRQRKPLLAICRGHQLLNVALGGTLIVDIPTELPRARNHSRPDRRYDIVHDAHLTPDSLLAKITRTQTLGVNSTHHQAVGRVAPPLRVTARSEDDVVEAMELKPEAARWLPFLLSVQFHPERLAERHPEHRAIFDAFARACARNRNTSP